MEPTQSPRSINGEYIMNCSYLSVSGNPFCVQADHRPQAACMNEEEAERKSKRTAATMNRLTEQHGSVPFRVRSSHNNTFRALERSLLAAGTDGYADTESGTSRECAVRVPKGFRD